MRRLFALLLIIMGAGGPALAQTGTAPDPGWLKEFPETDFARSAIDFASIITDGPRRDQIPAIDEPKFIKAKDDNAVGPLEPVLSVVIGGDARAYPLRILLWHEIVNDTVGGVPLLVSYCPLCNSGVVFDRRINGREIRFGNTGRIRHFDMVMYDHQTGSWWQQFTGKAIVGTLTDTRLTRVPARLESLARFVERAPDGLLLVPNDEAARPYGATPYVGMETFVPPAFLQYELPKGVAAMDRVIAIGAEAWPVNTIREHKTLRHGNLTFAWTAGQNSIHDSQVIAQGRDVGNVVVTAKTGNEDAEVAYDVTFAFAFAAFNPSGIFHID